MYTLRMGALFGEVFSSQSLIDSGVCPPSFQTNSSQNITLFKILEILEENDFIEMIVDEEINRTYRFNHIFLQIVLA